MIRSPLRDVVQAEDGELYILALLLAAYQRGDLEPNSPAERCAQTHLATRQSTTPVQAMKPN